MVANDSATVCLATVRVHAANRNSLCCDAVVCFRSMFNVQKIRLPAVLQL